MDPPKTHTTSRPFPGKEVLSPPLSEPSFPVVKKLIQKVLVALRNGAPQIGHFTLDTLIYEWGQRKIASRYRSGDLDSERPPPPYPQTAAFLDGSSSNLLMHAVGIY